MEPVILDPLVELKLEKALASMDKPALRELFQDAYREALSTREATAIENRRRIELEEAERALQEIHRIVKPAVSAKVPLDLVYKVWGLCKNAFPRRRS